MNQAQKHLVLLGAERTHIRILKVLSRQLGSDIMVSLVTPSPYYVEHAMLPAFAAQDCTAEDIRIPLDDIVQASGVNFIPAHVIGLDPVNRRIQLSTGDALPYDVLSIDVEPVVEKQKLEEHISGVSEQALFTRPNETFVQLWPSVLDLTQQQAMHIAILTDTLWGLELALCAAPALAQTHGSRVSLVLAHNALLEQEPASMQKRILQRFRDLGITLLQDQAVSMETGIIHLASGAHLTCDAPIMAMGADVPSWLLQSGLQSDEDGKLLLNDRLQSDSHRQVFVVPPDASADTASVLAHNLRVALQGGSFKKAPMNSPRLHLIACGDQQAIAQWGPVSLQSHEVWSWKERRDKKHLQALFQLF